MTASESSAARARHPSSWWPFDIGRMQRRVADDLAGEGHPWPERAAALLGLRGRLGLDRTRFALLLGVPEEFLAAIEEGRPPGGQASSG